MTRWLAYWMLGTTALGCGGTSGGDDDSGSDHSGLTPEQSCEQFADVWCNKALGCYSMVGRLPATSLPNEVESCIRVAIAGVPCDRAVAVGASYDQCLDDVEAMPCARWDVPESQIGSVTPPSACAGVIKIVN
jgi:hypothetical protein